MTAIGSGVTLQVNYGDGVLEPYSLTECTLKPALSARPARQSASTRIAPYARAHR